MDDYLIKRDVLRILKEYASKAWNDDWKPTHETVRGDTFIEACLIIDDMPTADVQPIDRWIDAQKNPPPIIDRRSMASELVLILRDNGRCAVAYYCNSAEDGDYWTTDDDKTMYCWEEVTHWQPLPELPKRGGLEVTLDETIKEFMEWAKNDRDEMNYWLTQRNESDETNPLSYADCQSFVRNAETSAEHYEQLAEWLTELKDLREENKVLTSECDRLIKEKGELLSKVGGGEICQLEEQIRDWKEEYAYINKLSYGYYKELKEAKLLLKKAIDDFKELDKDKLNGKCMMPSMDCACCPLNWDSVDDKAEPCHNWRYTNEALKIIGEANGEEKEDNK